MSTLKIRKNHKPFRAGYRPRKRELEMLERKHAKLHVRTGDLVRVRSGKDEGREGRVLRVMKKKLRAVVQGVNLVKKHQKPNQKNQKGGIVDVEAPIHVSVLEVLESASG